LGMTCPECSCLNTRSFTYVGSLTVQLVCAECGCIYSVKTIQEIAVLQHGKQA
jgi:transcription initiation factor TFIIIB Brf1 subunit/transcription initiation factor TFIIB